MHNLLRIHALYKKLVALYPQRFKEQLGESMEQTFNDLCKEKRQTKTGLLSFLLWTFIETAIGIVQEHIVAIKEMNPMKNMLTNIRQPVIIGFLMILPLIILEFAVVIVKRLAFDIRDALDALVTFGFLWLGVASILLILIPLVRDLQRAEDHRTADTVPARENTLLTSPRSAAIISFLLALPFLTIISLLLLNIEPPFARPFDNPTPDQPDIIGTLIVVGALVLAVAGCIIARVPIARTLQTGGSLFAHPINLTLALVTLSFITMLVVGLVVDQFPCWMGVPNCD
jgi:hypothetical protein